MHLQGEMEEMKEILVKQIETYSNGIITFIVLQGVAYSFYFGSNEMFNCHVKDSTMLAELLTVLFIIVTIMSVIAINYLGKKNAELVPEHQKLLMTITKGKIVVILIFGLLPAFLTFFYGTLVEVPKVCEKLVG
jgi:amino acid transporter